MFTDTPASTQLHVIPRYIVRPTPSIPPAAAYYVFDQSESPARTVATCDRKTDAELVRGGLEMLHALVLEPISTEPKDAIWLEQLSALEDEIENAACDTAWDIGDSRAEGFKTPGMDAEFEMIDDVSHLVNEAVKILTAYASARGRAVAGPEISGAPV